MYVSSRVLHTTELNYSTIDKEALALVCAVEHFRPYLFGRSFALITHHHPLTWFKAMKEPRGRLARWLLYLSESDWPIQHRPVRQITNADELSRHAPVAQKEEVQEGTKLDDRFKDTRHPPLYQPMLLDYAPRGQNPNWLRCKTTTQPFLKYFPDHPPVRGPDLGVLVSSSFRKV